MEIEKIYPRDLLDKWICGSMLDLYSNCNSKFRELNYATKRNDSEGINFWTKRIDLLTETNTLLFKWFHLREDNIKNENDFNNFMNIFKRYAEIKTSTTWFEICTGGKKTN